MFGRSCASASDELKASACAIRTSVCFMVVGRSLALDRHTAQRTTGNVQCTISPDDRLQAAATRQEMAGALDEHARLRGDGGSGPAEVLLPRDVRVSVGLRARR